MRPRIGITTSTLDRAPEGRIALSAATHLAYAECIYRAGGLPLLLPNVPEAAEADEVLALLDGLLLSGGGDMDPAQWGEAPHPALGPVDQRRDRYETSLLLAALRRDLPVLGICRGVQVMAVATGGNLWQDIPSQITGSLPHLQTTPRGEPSHALQVAGNSLLARILLPDAPADAHHLSIRVNSLHHQAPRKYGTVLVSVATSPDGVTEGLTAPEATFILGVQWHPEEMAATDPVQGRLFSAFVAAASGEDQ